MSSGPSITTLISEPESKSQDEIGNPSPNEAPQEESGDNHPSEPAKATEDSKSCEQGSAAANGIFNEPVPEAKPQQPNVGEKREHEESPSANKTNGPIVEQHTEPSSKKQKRGENHIDAANGTSTPVSIGSRKPIQKPTEEKKKKKGGRPRKLKDNIKRDIPTDGIGTRTRSRTKVVS